MTSFILNPKTLGGFIKSLSGLFITKDNPQGLTQTELTILIGLYSILLKQEKRVIDKEVKIELANMTNNKLQVVINYINKLKKKGVISTEDKLHPIFYKQQIIIQYGASTM